MGIVIIIVWAVISVGGALTYAYFAVKNWEELESKSITWLINQTLVAHTTDWKDKIFEEASSQLGFTRAQVLDFRIFGQDKIGYSSSSGVNFAYKIRGRWYLAGKGDYSYLPDCSEYVLVPVQYNPGCYDELTKQNKYLDAQGQSINYSPLQMIQYIKNY